MTIESSLGVDKKYPLNAKSLKLKIVFRHKEGQAQPQIVTFRGTDLSPAKRIVKFDQQTSISFRPVADGDTYISVVVTSEDRPGRFSCYFSIYALYGIEEALSCTKNESFWLRTLKRQMNGGPTN